MEYHLRHIPCLRGTLNAQWGFPNMSSTFFWGGVYVAGSIFRTRLFRDSHVDTRLRFCADSQTYGPRASFRTGAAEHHG